MTVIIIIIIIIIIIVKKKQLFKTFSNKKIGKEPFLKTLRNFKTVKKYTTFRRSQTSLSSEKKHNMNTVFIRLTALGAY